MLTNKQKHPLAKIWDSLAIIHLSSKMLGQRHLSTSAVHSSRSLSHMHRPAPFHNCCYPWWSHHSPDICTMLLSPLQLVCIFTQGLYWPLFVSDLDTWCQAMAVFHDPFNSEAIMSPKSVTWETLTHYQIHFPA